MKSIQFTIITFLVFLFQANNLFAQEYFPDHTQDPKWEVVTWNFWGGFCESRIFKTGDQVDLCDGAYIEVWNCNNNEENCRKEGYYQVQNDKVYVRRIVLKDVDGELVEAVNCEEPHLLMYDFGSNQNDTLGCLLNYSYDPLLKEFVVNNISQQEFQGEEREVRKMYFTPFPNNESFVYEMDWITGIGSNVHPFFSFTCFGDHCEIEEQLVKVTLGDKVIYEDSIDFFYPCEGWISNNNTLPPEEKLIVVPNPAENIVSIQGISKYDNLTVKIYDVMGAVKLTHHGPEIDVSSLSSGVYFISMQSSRNNYPVKLTKLIIQ